MLYISLVLSFLLGGMLAFAAIWISGRVNEDWPFLLMGVPGFILILTSGILVKVKGNAFPVKMSCKQVGFINTEPVAIFRFPDQDSFLRFKEANE